MSWLDNQYLTPPSQAFQKLGDCLELLPIIKAVRISEDGAGVYTQTIAIPKGFTVLDIEIVGAVVWDSNTTCVMDIGDTNDANGYFAGVDLKTNPAAKGRISFAEADTGIGAYAGVPRSYTTADTLTIVTTATGTTTTGKTTVIVTMIPTACYELDDDIDA